MPNRKYFDLREITALLQGKICFHRTTKNCLIGPFRLSSSTEQSLVKGERFMRDSKGKQEWNTRSGGTLPDDERYGG